MRWCKAVQDENLHPVLTLSGAPLRPTRASSINCFSDLTSHCISTSYILLTELDFTASVPMNASCER